VASGEWREKDRGRKNVRLSLIPPFLTAKSIVVSDGHLRTLKGCRGQAGSFPYFESLQSLRAKRSVSHEHQKTSRLPPISDFPISYGRLPRPGPPRHIDRSYGSPPSSVVLAVLRITRPCMPTLSATLARCVFRFARRLTGEKHSAQLPSTKRREPAGRPSATGWDALKRAPTVDRRCGRGTRARFSGAGREPIKSSTRVPSRKYVSPLRARQAPPLPRVRGNECGQLLLGRHTSQNLCGLRPDQDLAEFAATIHFFSASLSPAARWPAGLRLTARLRAVLLRIPAL
jgi:hypothetical protein